MSDTQEAAVSLSGDIDMDSVEAVSAPIFDALARGAHLQVDCSAVTFIDSRGLNMMARAQRIANERGTTLDWVNPPPLMLRLIQLTALHDYLTILRNPSSLERTRRHAECWRCCELGLRVEHLLDAFAFLANRIGSFASRGQEASLSAAQATNEIE